MPGVGGGLGFPLLVIISSFVLSVFSLKLLWLAHSLTWLSSVAMVDLAEEPTSRYASSANFGPWMVVGMAVLLECENGW